MPRVSNIERLMQREQPVLYIRTRTSVGELPALIGQSFGKLAACLARQGAMLCDAPYVCYHTMDMQNLDVEMGFPVAHPLSGEAEVQAGAIPEGPAAYCMYRGPYNGLGPVYEEMGKWMAAQGCTPVGTAYEFYLNNLEVAEEELLTKILLPYR